MVEMMTMVADSLHSHQIQSFPQLNPHSRPHARPYIDGRNEPIHPSDHHHHHHPPHPHPRFFCSAPLNPTKPRFVRLPRAVFGTGFHALIGGRRGHVERLMWSLNGVE